MKIMNSLKRLFLYLIIELISVWTWTLLVLFGPILIFNYLKLELYLSLGLFFVYELMLIGLSDKISNRLRVLQKKYLPDKSHKEDQSVD
ncbi:MAG: hypothetical protein COA79_13815 [Planctomycetota bacterium]|nr:MAG: hypothetical protein COA79_13815 [Planctomycetota bacterium]